MRKILTLVVALVLTIPMMAIGRNDGSTKANAIDFDWDRGLEHESGTKWYRVDLAPLYEEENPSLALYLTNPSNAVGTSVDVSMQATVAGQTESSSYTISARQYKTYTANASMLVRMKQTEIYLTLTTNGRIKLSAKVFEAADLDETCQDARTLSWGTEAIQTPSYSAWWKVSLTPIKNATDKDAKITITNTGNKELNLKVGQSLDCPSSGVTRRTYQLAPGEAVVDTVPRSMITSVQPDELYFGIENVESTISIKVEQVDQPAVPIIAATDPYTELHVTDTIEPLPAGTTLYRIKVADMDSLAKYEPEFTYRNTGATNAKVTVKMAFEVPAFGTSNTEYNLAPGEEEIVVYKKNMLEGMADVEYIYLLTTVEGTDVNFYGRFKHVREGKACKTNIDFNWTSGHSQEARTIQWYAVEIAEARDNIEDIVLHVQNLANAKATLKASLAFSCPYIDLQEISRTIGANEDLTRTLGYSSYAMMSDTVWIGLETNQDIRFWATTKPAQTKEPDEACLTAVKFDWDEGVVQQAGDTVWYKIAMEEVREKSAKFPTVFVQNLSSTNAVTITGELSLECPDSIANQKRSKTIEANGTYTKQLSRNLFENIVQDTIYLKVITTQDIALQIRLTEEAEGASCASAIPFNWVSGNSQNANDNLWYIVDVRNIMQQGNDIRLHIENRDNETCKGVAQLIYECPPVSAPSVQDFKLSAHGTRSITIQNSAFETLNDSVAYINLQGTTGLRVWAELLPLKDFDTIYADGITLMPLQWDTLYTQTVDTAWYIIPQSEIDKVRNLEEKVKPVAHLINLGSANTIKGEAAFAFPITKKMMTKSLQLKAGQHWTDTVPSGTFDQFLKKDSIILRVTRPAGSGDFQFRAELVGAFSGNSRTDALPILMDKKYTQSPNTEMWYKVNTANLKKDSLYNKVLYVMGKNAGQGKAKVKVSVYDGLLSEVDLFEEYGLEKYRDQTIPKGKSFSHNVPAQAVYGLGNVEMYIKIRTTDSLVFETKFNGEYAPAPVDPEQANAKLVVPNVDYVLPGDNQYHWYMICLPYLQNNYIYSNTSTLSYELNGKTTIEGTATFQDNMDCQMPVRKRTVNKKGTHYKGEKPLWELFNRGVKEAGYTFDISSFQPEFIDSLLHRFVTNDSVTFYIRVRSDKDIKARINTPQVTGEACNNPMAFDWEHGNVNPEGATTWYHVQLDSLLIPDTCDLRLHVANWSADSTTTTADIYFDCNDPKTKGGTYKIGEGQQDSIDIDRDLLQQLGWADMIINYSSDKATHIWAELIPSAPRDTLRDTIVAYVCQGDSYLDTITGITHEPIDYSTQWYDTISFQDGVVMKDSITWFQIHPLVAPEVLTVDSMKKLGAAPLLVQGMQLFVDSSNVRLMKYYQNLGNAVDTIITIDTVYWATPVYKANGDLDIRKENPLDLSSYYKKTDMMDTLLLVIKGGCETVFRQDVVFPIEAYKYAAKNDTVCPPAPAINPDTIGWTVLVPDTMGLPRQIDTIVTYYTRELPELIAANDITLKPTVANDALIDTTWTLRSLKQQFEDDATDLTMKVTDAKWQVKVGDAWQDLPYTVGRKATSVTMRYVITTECGDVLNSENVDFALTPDPCDPTSGTADPVTACDEYYWAFADSTITTSGTYTHVGLNVGGCDSTLTLTVTIHQSKTSIPTPVESCDSYYWAEVDTTITMSGTYTHVFTTTQGCDSTVTLGVTIHPSYNETPTPVEACDSYYWAEADKTITASGTYTHTFQSIHGCDSVVNLGVTIYKSTSSVETPVVTCDEYYWASADTTIKASGAYTHVFSTIHGCDSVVTLNATINKSADVTADPVTECNSYYWAFADSTIITSGTYTHTGATVAGCDSTVTINVTIDVPYETSLSLVHKYGNRLIMINRNEINAIPGWQLDSLDIEHPEYVIWHEIDLNGNDKEVGQGYYYNLASGEPLPTGYTYYAVVEIPATAGAVCGAKGETEHYTIPAPAGVPALVPSLARPGEEIRIINLDPETSTMVRIYSADGVLQGQYTVSGQETFAIKAADADGFYMVELRSENLQTTLRYIVK